MTDDLPPENLLPPPSILEKIKAVSPEALEKVMGYAECIGEKRRAQESGFFTTLRKSFLAAREGFYLGLADYPGPDGLGTPLSSLDPDAYQACVREECARRMKRDWARTGDSLRLGIRQVMAEYGLTESSLGLTDEEKSGLTLIFADSAPKPEQTSSGNKGLSGWIRNFFPKLGR